MSLSIQWQLLYTPTPTIGMLQQWLTSATGSVAMEHPHPTTATYWRGCSLRISPKNALSECVLSHCNSMRKHDVVYRWILWCTLPWELEGITSPCCLLIGQYPHHMTLCPPVAIAKRCYGIHLYVIQLSFVQCLARLFWLDRDQQGWFTKAL